jgi:hypothetical protein
MLLKSSDQTSSVSASTTATKLAHWIGLARTRRARGSVAAIIGSTGVGLLWCLVSAQQREQRAWIDAEEEADKNDDNRTHPADADGQTAAHAASVLDIYALPVADPTHSEHLRPILPMS